MTFDAAGSYDPDGTIVSHEWDWNVDGAVDETGVGVSHVFPTPPDPPGEALHTVAPILTDDGALRTRELVNVYLPEPSQWTLLLTGLASLGVAPRGRRRVRR